MSRSKTRVAIVSGAEQGIGEAFARRLAEEYECVLAFDCKDSIMRRFANDRIVPMHADVSKRQDVEAVVARAADLGEIALLVNNAGRWKRTPVDSSWEQAIADWDEIMDTNLRGVLMLSRAVVPHMIRAGGGDIVHISTYYVLPARSDGTNPPDTDLYNASKWALNGFTDAWSKSLARHDIRVNALCMGATDTPMLRGLFPNHEYPAGVAESVMTPGQIADQLVDLLKDGRSGENIGAWVGHPVELGERRAPHKRITG
jgi:NAD(P)-dependent dehydrogenase (short-subunit alcohol dehydrogenase family)